MDIYFAGGENKSWLDALNKAEAKNSLYSYFYLNHSKSKDEFLKGVFKTQQKVFMDSGAFSALTRGIEIDIHEYCDFLHQYKDKMEVYACLDVIGDFKGTQKNYDLMVSKGLKPLLTFHQGSPIEWLDEMKDEHDWMALGGMVGTGSSKKKMMYWLDKCFSIIKTDSKVHGFGYTSSEGLKRYPFYSVDSTSWLGGSMRAEIYKYENGHIRAIRTKDEKKANHTTMMFTDKTDGVKLWKHRVIKNAIEWQKFEKYLTDLWTKRGIQWH